MPLLTKPSRSQRQTEERLKLFAGGLQLLALTIIAAALINPLFRDTGGPGIVPSVLAGVFAAASEGAAFWLLRYIPASAPPTSSQEPPHV